MRRWLIVVAVVLTVMAGALAWWGGPIEFVLGGALVNAGYRLQDRLVSYDFNHDELTPEQVWDEFLQQNRLASSVRSLFPRSTRHPVIAMVTCMDGRLDTNEIAGDTRRYYYVIRTAGSVLAEKEEEMLELAVENGVKVVVFTTHTDCAAEKAARDPAKRTRFPQLTRAVEERGFRLQEFLGRPLIRERVQQGELLVKLMDLDTRNERAIPRDFSRP
ncbi:MAG: hypothetical protein NTV70_17535 [Acidobacteria bacterium]|nr:hypothetical protein [Acidobacteriota bacterium]